MNIRYLFVVKDEILEKKNLYIWGIGKGSKRLFLKLLVRGVHICGFVTNEKSKAGIKLYARPVLYKADEKIQNRCLKIILPKGTFADYPDEIIIAENELWKINDLVYMENINIWGAGKIGTEITKLFVSEKRRVNIYDTDKNKAGQCIEAIPVQNAEKLQGSKMIIAAAYSRTDEILDIAGNLHIDNIFLANELDDERIIFQGKHKCILKYRCNFYEILRDTKGKKCFLYGDIIEENRKQYEIFFRELGIEMHSVEGSQIYDLLYEERVYILIDGENLLPITKQLEDMGLVFGKDYNFLNAYRGDIFYKQRMGLDINLGYTKFDESKYPGFCVFGENNKKDLRIVTLGGSTTDATLYPFKSWSELLYNKMHKAGMNVTVFCGGVNGYQVSQELIKLIRDGIPLKPDIVISYSGLNNLDVEEDYPFYQSYQSQLFECLMKRQPMNAFNGFKRENLLSKGIKSEETLFAYWMRMQKYMKACCREENIKYLGILQPNMLNKKTYSLYEHEISVNFEWCQGINTIRHSHEFRKNICAKESGLYDFSDLFDNERDVYIDGGHVWEHGNEMIADKILRLIMNEGFLPEE